MLFRPRHYVLILIVLALGVYNYTRIHRLRERPAAPATPPQVVARGTSPVWSLYDNAAAVRDAPDAQFQPALKTLNQSIDSTNAVSIPPTTPPDEIADLHGCQTWLLFYRQEHLHPAVNKPGWTAQLQSHVSSCVANHRDIAQ
jgi:hypothetical protein